MDDRPVVEVYTTEFAYPAYPWMFRIRWKGRTFTYAGMPNHCATKRQAAIRGWWRARWMMDGTYDSRYR